VLGPHPASDGSATVVRAFLPGADHVVLLQTDTEPKQYEMRKSHPDGLFEVQVPAALPLFDYAFLVVFGGQRPVRLADPYRFRTTRFSAKDERLFTEGRHTRLFETLGAWSQVRQNTAGVAFGVWAPNAARVSVVGTFNGWDGRRHPMQRVGSRGIWELFIPGIAAGELYKFEIKTGEGAVFLKTDPFAVCCEATPSRASIVVDLDAYCWTDAVWISKGRSALVRERSVRGELCAAAPAAVPALPAGHSYLQLPASVAGPAGSGLLACGATFENPAAVMAWIDTCHRRGIGVMLPFDYGLLPAATGEFTWFDGTRLYERSDAADALTPSFDLARGEVRSVLLSSVVFWLERLPHRCTQH
jgi:1,4-alpha-glucan branching enzyme